MASGWFEGHGRVMSPWWSRCSVIRWVSSIVDIKFYIIYIYIYIYWISSLWIFMYIYGYICIWASFLSICCFNIAHAQPCRVGHKIGDRGWSIRWTALQMVSYRWKNTNNCHLAIWKPTCNIMQPATLLFPTSQPLGKSFLQFHGNGSKGSFTRNHISRLKFFQISESQIPCTNPRVAASIDPRWMIAGGKIAHFTIFYLFI